MLGEIYSDQTCPLCGTRFQDNFRSGFICPTHPDQPATQFRVYSKGFTKSFSSHQSASSHISDLRFEIDKGKFDPGECRKSHPLGFENLCLEFLKIKEREVKKSSRRKIADHLYKR